MQYEIIVKYSGDLSKIEAEIPAIVEPLNNSYAIITLDEADIDKLFTYKEIEFIEMPRALMISQSYPNIDELRSTCATPVLDSGNLTGEGTIVAILDSGINYKSKEFLNIETNETRIINIWDQNSKQGTPPAPFKLGTEYNKDEISSGTIQTVDELGHGTSVAAIAAGSTIGVSRGCSILIVKLPNSPKTTDLMRAISYSVNRARDLSMPIVINISFGTNDGSHDGFSLFERFIDEMSYEWKTNIVVAMGNEGDTGRHFTDTLTTGQTIDVEFYISANIRELSINLWKNFVDDFEFELYSPDGLISDKVFIESIIPNYLNTAEEVYLNFQNPEAGAWRLRVFGKRIVVGLFHMWLPISERIEAYFLAPNAEITLTIPATSFGVISVGAYNSALDTYASFSGRGNTRIFENVKPDIVAPGVSVYTMSANGSYEPKTGTSFAAPFVTGSVAILLQWGIVQGNDPFLYGQRIKAYLRKGATRAPGTTYPNKQWGYGKLCLAETLNLLNSNEYNKANFPNIVLPPIFNDEDLLIDGENSENIIPIENTTPSIEEELPNTAESFEAENTVPAMAFIAYNDNGVKDPLANFDNVLNVHERILSEDYIELVVRMNSNVSDFVNSSEEVFVTTLLTEYGILYIPKSLEAEFYNTFGKKIISEFPKNLALMGREALEASNITTVQNHPYLNLRGTGALVAIIDTGINYANESFVYEDNSTKIEYLWDQTLEGTPPAGFLFGNEFTAEEITEALQTGKLLQTTDEIGHGTNLAAIAAGREVAGTNKIGAAPDASLIVVKLKQANNNIKDLTGINPEKISYSSSDLMQAVEYVRNKALQLNMPIAICIGVGTNEGSHDGLSIFEEYLSSMAIKNGVIISAAMGNEGRARTHVQGKLTETGEERDIEVRIGDGETGIAIFLYANEPDKISVSITSPTGEFINAIPSQNNSFYETTLLLEKSTVGVRYEFASVKNATEGIFVRIIDPTPGIWTLRIKGELVIDGTFNAWLPVTSFITQDTYFLEPTVECTGTVPSTASSIVAVGAYDSESSILFVSTSRGPTRLGLYQPSIVAPGVNVLGVTPLTGTSAAAAITTGAAALLLEWAITQGNYPIFNSVRARSYLTAGATRRDTLQYPNNQWGYGTLNLFATFETMRRS